jgi:hypothetical protein
MPNVVMVDCGDYWHVIADYSGSPRHMMMNAAAWAKEYSSHASYATMRTSHPTAVAATIPRGAGRWTKDFSKRLAPVKKSAPKP